MTIEKYGHTFQATCDYCPEDLDTDEDEFMSAVASMKRQGWKVFKEGAEWCHKCPDCAGGPSSEDFDVV